MNERTFWRFWKAVVVLCLVFWAVVIFVAWHFLSKVW